MSSERRMSAKRRTGSRARLLLAVATGVAGLASSSRAAWQQTAAGTYDYLSPTNWVDGTIDDSFPSTLTLAGAQTLTFGSGRATPGGMNFSYGGNYGLTLRGTGGDRTLTLGGDVVLATTGGTSANVALGSTTAGQGLNVDLGGTTRTFSTSSGRTLSLYNVVSNGGINLTGGSLALRGLANTFSGGISVSGASTVLKVGEQGSISDGTFGSAGNDLSLSNGATVQFGANNDKAHVLVGPQRTITLSNGGRFSTPYATANVTISGDIVGSGGLSTGQVTAQLIGNNTFSGGITYDRSLRISSDANIGSSASAINRGNSAGTAGISVLGTGLTNLSGHALGFGNADGFSIDIQDPANTFTWDRINNRSMNSGANPTFVKDGAGTLHVTAGQGYSNISGIATVLNGGVMKVDYAAGGSLKNDAAAGRLAFGGGTLYLLGKTDGPITQTLSDVRLDSGGGTIVVDNHSASSATTLNLGTFSFAAAAPGSSLNVRTINAGTGSATVTTTASNDATGIIAAGRVVYNGTGFATNTTGASGGAIGAYTGATTGLGDATVGSTVNYVVSDSPALPAAATYANTLKIQTTLAGQGIDLNGQTLSLTAGALLFTGADDYTITNGTLKSGTATNSDLIVHQYGNGTLTLGSVIANGNGVSTLTLAGAGTVVLSAANTYTGQTYVNGATLSISNNNQLNNGANTQLNLNGGTLQATQTISTGRPVFIGGSGATFDVASGKTLTISGALSGGRLTLANTDGGTGALVLSGANSFAGGVVIDSGILRLGNSAALHAQGFNTLSFGSGSTAMLQINGARTVTVAGLTSASNNAVVENGAAGAAMLNVYSGADNVFAGTLRDGAAGTLGLAKAGTGKLTLTGTNTYSGPTTLYGGTLAVNGSILNSAISVYGGKLSGTGTLGGLTVGEGGTLAAGNSVGTLAVSTLALSAGAIVEVEFGGSANDRTMVSASDGLSIAGGEIYLFAEGTQTLPTLGAGSYHLLGYTGTLGGSLANLAVANDNPTDNTTYAFATSVDGGQNYVDLVVSVPEPLGLGAIGLAATALLGRPRRRVRLK